MLQGAFGKTQRFADLVGGHSPRRGGRHTSGVIGGDAFEKAVDERPQFIAGSRLDEHVIHKIRFKFDTIRRP